MKVSKHLLRPDEDNALLSAFMGHVQREPDAVAISGPHGDVRYAGLQAAAASFAAGLDRHGIGSEDIVAFEAEPSVESIALMLGIAANGAAWLPLAPDADPRLAESIEEVAPQLVIGGAGLRARLPLSAPWIERAALVSPQPLADPKPCGLLAYVLLESGRHGGTHGIAMRTRDASELIDWQRRHARLGKAARTLQFSALHGEGAFGEIFCTLACGGTLVLSDETQRRDLSALLAHLHTARIERVFLPAALVEMLANVIARRREALPHTLLDVVTGGEQLQFTPEVRDLFGALHDCVLHIQYGPTHSKSLMGRELTSPPHPAAPPHVPEAQPLPHRPLYGPEPPATDAWRRSSAAVRTAALLRAARGIGASRAAQDGKRLAKDGTGG